MDPVADNQGRQVHHRNWVLAAVTGYPTRHRLHSSDTYVPVSLSLHLEGRSSRASVLGDMLIHERDIRRKPPMDPESILSALKRVRGFQSRLKSILDRLPRVFRFLDEEDNVYVLNAFLCHTTNRGQTTTRLERGYEG
jgi:hypothetical protein